MIEITNNRLAPIEYAHSNILFFFPFTEMKQLPHFSLPFSSSFFLPIVYASSADIDVVDEAGSIYNGDENHKVWLGSQDRLNDIATESPYDFYSANGITNGNSSTLGRNARARQISAPIPVPPPPELKKEKKQKKSKQQSSSQSLSGTLRPKSGYTNGGTLVRQQHQNGNGGVPMHHQHQMHHMHPQNMGPYGPLPMHAQALPPSRFHTFSHRGYANGIPHSTSVPHLHMIPMHHPPPMQMPVMLPQQYATLQHPRNLKSKKKKDKMQIPLGIPVPPPMFAYPPPASMIHESNRPLAMSNRKLAQSAAAGLDDSGNSGGESPGDTGTGIYRRKGHLNERAFSYSIRQEHRSRSHGSLASLQFNNPPDVKKEREIAQMVAGLELNDDATIYRRSQPQTNGGTFGKRK